jgi:predicted aldo/keto reductase-like oxidoreductase
MDKLMEYAEYGKTGLKISRLAFGAMRFPEPQNIPKMAEAVLAAYEAGINYFDTAPGYCADMSEKIVGHAVKQMKRGDKKFYISTKTGKQDAQGVRADLAKSLERLNVDCIDFYHCWYILSLDGWEKRKAGGAVDAILRAREEGLVKHVAFTTHLPGDEMKKIIDENIFEGVTLGYNAVNFPYREEGVKAAGRAGLGVVVMNPLGGGTIPENPAAFHFIRNYPGQPMVEAALHFLWAHEEITAALVGFRSPADVRGAVDAWKNFVPGKHDIDLNKLKSHIENSFDKLCTSCRYCRDCPQGIEIYKFIEAYNHLLLKGGESLHERLGDYYGIHGLDQLELCTACAECEDACPQHLPILERFEELKKAYNK